MNPGREAPAAEAHAEVLVPAPFVYAGLILASILLNWVLPLAVRVSTTVLIVGFVLVVAGLILGVWAVVRMLSRHTPVSPEKPVTTLVTDGPFRFTRNPIYLGFLMVFLGFTLLLGTLWGLILSPLVPLMVNYLVIGPEETYLQERFFGPYQEYKRRVRKWI